MLEVLAWTLVHSLWQGLAIGTVAALALSTVPDRPRVKHTIAMTALMSQFVAGILTGVSDLSTHVPTPVIVEGTRIVRTVSNPMWMKWVVVAWSLGVLFMATRLALGIRHSRSLRRHVEPLPPEVTNIIAELARTLRLSTVNAALSNAVAGPQVVGVLRPVLLVPTATLLQLSPEQLRAVLAHELAHLLHHDPVTQAAQEAVAMLFFYHPVTWWLTRVARQSREHACDDVAAKLVSKRAIATALFELETHRVDSLALAASGELTSRIQRLTQPARAQHTRFAGGFAAAAITLLVAGPALASDRAAERDFRRLEAQTEALIALSISAPDGIDQHATDDALKGSLGDKVDALEAVEAAVQRVVRHERDEWSSAAIVQLGSAYEDMGVSLTESTVPYYLSADQIDVYRMALNDQASAQYDKAVDAYQRAIDLNGSTEWTAEAQARLVVIAQTRERLASQRVTPPPADPERYRADLAIAIPQIEAFQQRCGGNDKLRMFLDQLTDEDAMMDPALLADFQIMLTDLLEVTAPDADCMTDE